MQNNYKSFSDEELVKKANAGETEALEYLVEKYSDTVKIIARPYYLVGGSEEDLISEGMIGLFGAVRSYDAKSSEFKTFAALCIKRRIISAVRKSNGNKDKPLNNYVSLNNGEKDDMQNIELLVNAGIEDPETEYINKERYAEIQKALSSEFSDFEKRVLDEFLSGKSYVEISEDIKTSFKSVDNAMQRIRKKILKIIQGVK